MTFDDGRRHNRRNDSTMPDSVCRKDEFSAFARTCSARNYCRTEQLTDCSVLCARRMQNSIIYVLFWPFLSISCSLIIKKSISATISNIRPWNLVRCITTRRYVDYLLVMAYNYHGSWNKFTGHHSGLFPRSDEVAGEREWNQVWCLLVGISSTVTIRHNKTEQDVSCF